MITTTMIMMKFVKSEKQEGDDVYFECLIVSNPAATRLEWFHRVSCFLNIQIIMLANTILVMTVNVITNSIIKAINMTLIKIFIMIAR